MESESKMVVDILKGKILKPLWSLIDVLNEIKGIVYTWSSFIVGDKQIQCHLTYLCVTYLPKISRGYFKIDLLGIPSIIFF